MVVTDRGRAPSVSVTVADDGSLTPSCGSIAIPASVSPRCAQTISFLRASPDGRRDPRPGEGTGPGVRDGTAVASDATLGHRVPVRLVEDDLAEVPDVVRLWRGRRMVVVELEQSPLTVADLEEAHDLALVIGVLADGSPVVDGGSDPLCHD